MNKKLIVAERSHESRKMVPVRTWRSLLLSVKLNTSSNPAAGLVVVMAKTLFLYDSNIVLLQKYRLQDMVGLGLDRPEFLRNKTLKLIRTDIT